MVVLVNFISKSFHLKRLRAWEAVGSRLGSQWRISGSNREASSELEASGNPTDANYSRLMPIINITAIVG
jgi:hypothetical protein